MSRVDDLIADLCPDGVEFRALRALGRRNKGIQITAAQMKHLHTEGAPIRVFAGGATKADVVESTIPHAAVIREPSIIVHSRGHIGFTFCAQPFTHKSELWSYTLSDPDVLQKFVYYYLLTQVDALQAVARATSVKLPQLAVGDTDRLRVPVPPIEVQREVVRGLDTFTELEGELEAELEARRRQYTHYRDSLLASGATAEPLPLGDVLETLMDYRGRTPKKLGGDWTATGHRVISALNVKDGRIDDNDHHYIDESMYSRWMRSPMRAGDVLLTSEAPLGAVAYLEYDVDWAVGQRLFVLRSKDDLVNGRYLYHLLAGGPPRAQLFARATGSTVTGIRQAELVNLAIPVPPLAEQERIVTILDSFDALVNDLSVGLPAELAARRKQYEHYRDRMLTFKERAA